VTDAMTGLSASTKYLVIAQACVGGNDANATFGFQIIERDTGETDLVVSNSEMIREPSNTTKPSDYTWSGIVTTRSGGADSGFMFQQKAVSSGTAKVDYVSIVAIDLSELTEGSDYFVSDDATNVRHTTSAVKRNDYTIDAADAKDNTWLLLGFMRTDANNTANSAEIVFQQTTTSGGTETMYTALFEAEDTTEQLQHVMSYGKAFTIDEDVMLALWSRDDGGFLGANEYMASSIIGLRLSAFEQYWAGYSATPDLDNGPSFNDRHTSRITPDTSGTIVLIGTMIANLQATGRRIFQRLQIDDTSIPNTLLESTHSCRTYDNTDLIPVNVVATHSVTADTIYPFAYQFKENYSGTGVNESGFVVFSTELAATTIPAYNVIAAQTNAAGDVIAQSFQAGDVKTQSTQAGDVATETI